MISQLSGLHSLPRIAARPEESEDPFSLSHAIAAREVERFLFDPERARARMTAFENYAAGDERDQSMHESRLPFHHRLDLDSDGRLRPPPRVETTDQQSRSVKLFMHDQRSLGPETTVE